MPRCLSAKSPVYDTCFQIGHGKTLIVPKRIMRSFVLKSNVQHWEMNGCRCLTPQSNSFHNIKMVLVGLCLLKYNWSINPASSMAPERNVPLLSSSPSVGSLGAGRCISPGVPLPSAPWRPCTTLFLWCSGSDLMWWVLPQTSRRFGDESDTAACSHKLWICCVAVLFVWDQLVY